MKRVQVHLGMRPEAWKEVLLAANEMTRAEGRWVSTSEAVRRMVDEYIERAVDAHLATPRIADMRGSESHMVHLDAAAAERLDLLCVDIAVWHGGLRRPRRSELVREAVGRWLARHVARPLGGH